MAALAELVVFAIRLLGLYILVRFLARVLRGPAPRSAARPSPPRAPAVRDLVRDRVCNTFLPRERAVVAVVEGREEHFCSAACRDRAVAAAAKAS